MTIGDRKPPVSNRQRRVEEELRRRQADLEKEIAEREQAELSLSKMNRALQALSACNEALVRTTDETELLNKVCRIIVEIAGYRLAWVGFAEHDEMKTVRPVAQAGYEEGYLDTVNITWADTERGRGPTGTAIRTGEPNRICNIMRDPRYVPWRDAARERGYCSAVALPLIIDKEKAFGTLNIYATEANAFDAEELRMLQELADDLAFGIATLRSHAERLQLQRQLQQAQKMEAIGQLTGGIAHDFNNILASILGFTGLALERHVRDEDVELREYLGEVYHAGERARDLITQMLAFSRGGSNESQRVVLQPLVKEAVKMLRATLPSTIKLSTEFDKDVPAVVLDPVQLHQVVMNLCINARDATGGKGHIDIRVRHIRDIGRGEQPAQTDASILGVHDTCNSCHADITAGEYVELSVHDTGTGMNKDQLSRIFQPFFTTKEVGKGSGMGLSMAHGIVHQHGGHILVDSVPGVGTTFRVLFPAADSMPTQDQGIEGTTKRITEKLHSAHILIVDDEISVGRFMGDLFESRGYRVMVMSDAQAALDLFTDNPNAFDLVVTDQTMPELTGVELTQKLLDLRSELPVILCTGHSEQVDEARARELGVRGYLTKPMEANVLLGLAQELLQNSNGREPAVS